MFRALPLLLLLFLVSSSPLFAQTVRITEFLATNVTNIVDEDNTPQGWIEIWNYSVQTLSNPSGRATLNQCRLTDGTTVWTIPTIDLAPDERMIIWASGKNRTTAAAPLHTSFTLAPGGGTLTLQNSVGTALSSFTYPAQQPDVSWGRDETDTAVLATVQGSYTQPTPGERNNYAGTGVAGKVAFDKTSRAYTGSTTVTLTQVSPLPGAEIRYTTNGTLPNASSALYTDPLNVTTTQRIRARVFKDGLLPGETETQSFLLLGNTTASFTSTMPIMVLSTFGVAVNSNASDPTDQDVYIWVWQPAAADGIARLSDPPTLVSRAAIDRRGSSTFGNPKFNLNMEFRKARDDDDRNQPLLGMPSHSDWVLGAPYDFDRSLLHNTFAYALSRSVGRYAPRIEPAEVFIDVNGGALDTTTGQAGDYYGIYEVTEKIRRDKNRVDVTPLNMYDNGPVEKTGGYIFKVDRIDPGDGGFSAGGQTMAFYYPKEVEIREPQRDPQEQYLANPTTGYIARFNQALQSTNFRDPVTGYAAWIDVPVAIDHHILNVWPLNLDGFRLSGYWSKERGGKLIPGPVWDYDRTMFSTDGRDGFATQWRSPVSDFGTDFFNYTWWNRMFQDIDFYTKYVDRWQELRRGPLAKDAVNALLDSLNAKMSAQAVTRDVARWGRTKRGWTNYTGQTFPAGQAAEVQRIKDFMQRRAEFMDSQWVGPVTASVAEGNVAAGTQVTLAGPANATIYYTLNGADPRPSGGAAPAAGTGVLTYDGTPITITATTRLRARAHNPSFTALTGANNPPLVNRWSGMTNVRYSTDAPVALNQLAVTEISYHPTGATAAELTAASTVGTSPILIDRDFEFIEIRNIGTATIDLGSAKFTSGIQFEFSGLNAISLAPGEYAVIASNPTAFAARYGSTIPILGGWTGDLANEGEQLVIKAADGTTLLDFTYNDEWYVDTDGSGSSLEFVGTSFTSADYNNPANYRPSSEITGTPGSAGAGAVGSIVINEILTNSSLPRVDAIELYNPTQNPVDISNWFISDANDPTSTEGYKQYKIPAGTVIAPGAYLVLTEAQFNPNGLWNPTPGPRGVGEFAFDADHGDDAWLVEADAAGKLIRFVDHVEFGASRMDESWGRWPNITGDLYPMTERTLLDESSQSPPVPGMGAQNSTPRFGPLLISEVEHSPDGDEVDLEFVEIHNPTSTDQPLAQWRLAGSVDFLFTNESIPAGGTLVVTAFSPTDAAKVEAFRAFYNVPATATVTFAGPWELEDRLVPNGRVVLYRAETPPLADPAFFPRTLEDETNYLSGDTWPVTTEGLSLTRSFPGKLGDLAGSWTALKPTPGRINTAPVATDDVLHVPLTGNNLTLDVRANDTDPDGDPRTIVLVDLPSNGTAGTDGSMITYTPGPNYRGADQFSYTITDGFGGVSSGMVTLINGTPSAVKDVFHPVVQGTITLDVQANDTDPNEDARVVVSVGSAAHGTVTTDGSMVTYTPSQGYEGVDTFTYTVSDGYGATSTGTVELANAKPVATDDVVSSAGEAVNVNVLANDTDTDLDTLSVTGVGNAAAGTVTFGGTSVTYTPGASYFGTDSFTYTVSDGHGGAATANVVVQSSGALSRVDAITGSTVPGGSGMVYTALQVPAIGDDLALAYLANVTGAGIKSKTVLVGGSPSTVLFGSGDAIPGLGGFTFTKLGTPVTDDAGRILFVSGFAGPGISKKTGSGVFATAPGGATTAIARLGDPAPGVAGATFAKFTAVDGDGGEALYSAKLSSRNGTGVWAWDGTASTLVQRTGASVSTPSGDKVISSISVLGAVPGSPGHGRSHRAGKVAMTLEFTDKSSGVAIATRGTEGWSTTVILTSGTPLSSGGTLKSFGPASLAAPGSVAVLASLDGLSKTGDTAVILISATGVVTIAREGEASPVAGATYKSFSDPVANADGSVAFAAELSTGPALLVRNAEGQLSVVAQAGQAAPQAAGATWKKFVSFALPDDSNSGPIFLAEVTGAGVSKKNKLGLWAQDETGNLVLLARTGSAIPGGNPSKIVSKLAVLNALPPAQGSSRSYNDARSIAFLATFTDRSQAIQLVRVP